MIACTHCGLDVLPEQYPIVHKHLMAAIGEVLGDAVTPDIGGAWSEAVLFLAKICIDAEEAMYKAAAERPGGWTGFQPFTVTGVTRVTDSVKRFSFEPKDKSDGIDFTPGQFLTIRIDPNGDGLTAPRHYTITSAPGAPKLECCVKRVEGGEVSSYLHDSLAVGDTIRISPPFGCFTPRDSPRKAILLSAGIGVTPLLSIALALGDKVALVAHVDASPKTHAYAERFSSFSTLFKYASEGGRVVPEDFVKEIFSQTSVDGPDAMDVYLCGPPRFEKEMREALKAVGAPRVYSEAFKGHMAEQ